MMTLGEFRNSPLTRYFVINSFSFSLLSRSLHTGQSPYPGKSAESVLKDIKMGYRMPQPVNCPQSM